LTRTSSAACGGISSSSAFGAVGEDHPSRRDIAFARLCDVPFATRTKKPAAADAGGAGRKSRSSISLVYHQFPRMSSKMADLRHPGEAHERERGASPPGPRGLPAFAGRGNRVPRRTWWIVIEPALPSTARRARVRIDSPLEEGGFELALREMGTPGRARAGGSDLSGKIADENGLP
jgi:hypothetical protein